MKFKFIFGFRLCVVNIMCIYYFLQFYETSGNCHYYENRNTIKMHRKIQNREVLRFLSKFDGKNVYSGSFNQGGHRPRTLACTTIAFGYALSKYETISDPSSNTKSMCTICTKWALTTNIDMIDFTINPPEGYHETYIYLLNLSVSPSCLLMRTRPLQMCLCHVPVLLWSCHFYCHQPQKAYLTYQ